MAHSDGDNASKQIQILFPLRVPHPLHRSLLEYHRLPEVGRLVDTSVDIGSPDSLHIRRGQRFLRRIFVSFFKENFNLSWLFLLRIVDKFLAY